MRNTSTGSRSDPWTWWYRLCLTSVCTVFLAIGAALIFGPPRWERSNSLEVIQNYCHVPWPAWGIGFWAGAAIIAWPRTRKAGYLLSAAVGSVFVCASVFWTVIPGKTTNPIVIGMSLLSPLLLVAGARYVTQQEAEREVRTRLDDEGTG